MDTDSRPAAEWLKSDTVIALILVAVVIFIGSVIVLISVPRRRAKTYVDISKEPLGREAIQDAIENFLRDNGQTTADRVPLRDDEDIGRRLGRISDMISELARNQKSDSDIFVIVLKVNAAMFAIISGVVALIAEIVHLTR